MTEGASLFLWLRRLGWFVLLWVSGVAILTIAALAFRLLMTAAGLSR